MNKQERNLLNLCLQDQLFCSMYSALRYMHQQHHMDEPQNVWVESLSVLHEIINSPRPDMMADMMLDEQNVCLLGTLLFMLTTQDMCHPTQVSELKDVVCSKLNGCQLWQEFYEQLRLSEEKEEQQGRFVGETDFSGRDLPNFDASTTDVQLVGEVVETTLAMNDSDYCRKLAYVLRRIDDQHGGIYHSEIIRLEGKADDNSGKPRELLEEIAGQQEKMAASLKKGVQDGVTVNQITNYRPQIQTQNIPMATAPTGLQAHKQLEER